MEIDPLELATAQVYNDMFVEIYDMNRYMVKHGFVDGKRGYGCASLEIKVQRICAETMQGLQLEINAMRGFLMDKGLTEEQINAIVARDERAS